MVSAGGWLNHLLRCFLVLAIKEKRGACGGGSGDGAVDVSTKYGVVRGFSHRVAANFSADVFFGVPFAAPPVGRLRFEANQKK
jgi:hypothetical protein